MPFIVKGKKIVGHTRNLLADNNYLRRKLTSIARPLDATTKDGFIWEAEWRRKTAEKALNY